MPENISIARKHLDQRFEKIQAIKAFARPQHGWIRAIRDALGMSAAQLADRLGVSQPRITKLEQGEIKSTLSLQTLEKAAEALGCTLVYALIPHQSLEKTVREQAEKLAAIHLKTAGYTMSLEGQPVARAAATAQRKGLVEEILRKGNRHLWDRL